jgi:hypothetical protein
LLRHLPSIQFRLAHCPSWFVQQERAAIANYENRVTPVPDRAQRARRPLLFSRLAICTPYSGRARTVLPDARRYQRRVQSAWPWPGNVGPSRLRGCVVMTRADLDLTNGDIGGEHISPFSRDSIGGSIGTFSTDSVQFRLISAGAGPSTFSL